MLGYNLLFPTRAFRNWGEWIGSATLADVARAVEDAGFEGFAMTEHPYPSKEWLVNGGHHAFDPFVSLAVAGQATERLRLITYLMVAAYRNPYAAAKSVASLDVLSNGRLTLGMGGGYLKAEFEALGADFAQRGPIFDESIAAMRAAWTGVDHDGPLFGITGHEALPRPVQAGGPPIWVGGNSKAAQRRVVEMADGWLPMAQDAKVAAITRTPALETIDELTALIKGINERRSALGKPAASVSFVPFEFGVRGVRTGDEFADAVLPSLDAYVAAGVTHIGVEPRSRNFEEFRKDVEVLGRRVINQ